MHTPSLIPSTTGRIARLLAARRNYCTELQSRVSARRNVVFYGCGVFFESLLGTWSTHVGRKIDFCCDSDPEKWGKYFFGIHCISPSDLEKIKDDCTVFVTVGDFEPVCSFLQAKKFPSVHLIYKYDLISSEFLSQHDPLEVAEKMEQTRSILTDETSIQVFDAITDRFLDSNAPAGIMSAVCMNDQYFPPGIIHLETNECFVDAGAFNGDTLRDFFNRTHGLFSHVDCFELDSTNYAALQKTALDLNQNGKIILHPSGLWNSSTEITYSIEKAQSAIGAGEIKGKVVRLDDALPKARITYLKMDIEGAELKALEGARETILANKPKLAICVYHHFKDLWEIPLFIKNLVPEYRIFLRHHTKLEYETVCYAIPHLSPFNERS